MATYTIDKRPKRLRHGDRVVAGFMFGCILLVSTGFASIIED